MAITHSKSKQCKIGYQQSPFLEGGVENCGNFGGAWEKLWFEELREIRWPNFPQASS